MCVVVFIGGKQPRVSRQSKLGRHRKMSRAMDHIRRLSVDIGPRGSTTKEERAAGEYVVEAMKGMGMEAWLEEFSAVPTFSWVYLIYYLVPLAGLVIALFMPWVGAAVGVLGAIGFLLELNGREIVAAVLPKRTSVNAIGRLRTAPHVPSSGSGPATRPKFIISSHLDSSKAALNFKPGMVESFRASFIIMVGSMIAGPALTVLYAATAARPFWWTALLPAAYLIVTCGFLLHREAWSRYTHGANDNASGVGAMLAVAESAARGEFGDLDLWFIATGCEESGTYGMARFLDGHRDELKGALVINVDNVGAGRVHYMAGEGMFPTWKSSPGLLALAEKAKARRPDLAVERGVYNLMSTDALPAMVRGYGAMSLLSTRNGLLPNWHWVTDTFENVEEEAVETCVEFVKEMLKAAAS